MVWRDPENVALDQGRSVCCRNSVCGPASCSTSASSRTPGPRCFAGIVPARKRERGASRWTASLCMAALPFGGEIVVHEGFDAYGGGFAWDSAVAQIEYEAGIVRGEASELGAGHVRLAQEALDLAQEHLGKVLPLSRRCLFTICSN